MSNYKYLKHTKHTLDQLKKSGVYCLYHNQFPEKIYVGSTKNIHQGFYKRMSDHIYYCKKQKHHNKNIQKIANEFGCDGFVFEILEIVKPDFALIREREQYWIDKLKPYDFGLNISHSSISNKGVVFEKNGKLSKPVCMYDFNGNILAEFPSAREAFRITGICPKTISSCCVGKTMAHKNTVWRFKGEDFNKFKTNKLGKYSIYTVLQLDIEGNLIREWSSLKEVSDNLKISLGNLSSCIYGSRKTAGGFKFIKKAQILNRIKNEKN